VSGPDAELEQLRRAAAAEHGLAPEAARFLIGTSLTELTESAAALADLIRERDDQKPVAGVAELFSPDARARRKQQLTALFCGRALQPRDRLGRFAKSASFDGGAREPLPSPPPSHDETLVRILRDRRADAGAHL
jgi:hypothetical protein